MARVFAHLVLHSTGKRTMKNSVLESLAGAEAPKIVQIVVDANLGKQFPDGSFEISEEGPRAAEVVLQKLAGQYNISETQLLLEFEANKACMKKVSVRATKRQTTDMEGATAFATAKPKGPAKRHSYDMMVQIDIDAKVAPLKKKVDELTWKNGKLEEELKQREKETVPLKEENRKLQEELNRRDREAVALKEQRAKRKSEIMNMLKSL
jgi:DNA repair exonuclease SbcCD nuclease subunit